MNPPLMEQRVVTPLRRHGARHAALGSSAPSLARCGRGEHGWTCIAVTLQHAARPQRASECGGSQGRVPRGRAARSALRPVAPSTAIHLDAQGAIESVSSGELLGVPVHSGQVAMPAQFSVVIGRLGQHRLVCSVRNPSFFRGPRLVSRRT